MLDRMLWTWRWISWFHRSVPPHPLTQGFTKQPSQSGQSWMGGRGEPWAAHNDRHIPGLSGIPSRESLADCADPLPPNTWASIVWGRGARPTSAWHGALHLRSELHNEILSVTSAGVGIKRIKGQGSRHPLPQTWQHLSKAVWRLLCHVSASVITNDMVWN